MDIFLEKHSGELVILLMAVLAFAALLILVPQLLRARRYSQEIEHAEHLKALEKGQVLRRPDERALAAGRTAVLVPMVAVCAAATVTCFLAAYKPEDLFAVSLAIWTVTAVVGLAAITGGVALMGRLAQLQMDDEDMEPPSNPLA